MQDKVHEFVRELWNPKNPIRRHILKILGAKRNRLEILQEISYSLLKNYTRTSLTIEDGPKNIELYVYKMANDFRKWKIAIDKSPKWANTLDKAIPDLDLYQFRDEPDLFAEVMVIFLEKGVQELDRDIFFKYWREEHSQIYIAFKMEIALSYVLRSLKMTLHILRKELNPSYKNPKLSGQWKTDTKRVAPKQTPEVIAKVKATKALLPRLECPKCKRKLTEGKYREHNHGPNCTKTPIDANRVPNPNKVAAHKGKPKPKGECIYCKTVMDKSNLARHHNDNCKLKPNN